MAAGQFLQQQAGDQISAYDEEDVDADEAAAEEAETGMEKDNGNDRDGAKAVDFRSVAHRPPSALPKPNMAPCRTSGLRTWRMAAAFSGFRRERRSGKKKKRDRGPAS